MNGSIAKVNYESEQKRMTMSDDDREMDQLDSWNQAERKAAAGDFAELAMLLRYFSIHPNEQTHEVPNLSFVADILVGKFDRTAGRPTDSKILAGVKKIRGALLVHEFIENQNMSLENAVTQAALVVLMSESAIKKHYLDCKRHGLLKPPDDTALMNQ